MPAAAPEPLASHTALSRQTQTIGPRPRLLSPYALKTTEGAEIARKMGFSPLRKAAAAEKEVAPQQTDYPTPVSPVLNRPTLPLPPVEEDEPHSSEHDSRSSSEESHPAGVDEPTHHEEVTVDTSASAVATKRKRSHSPLDPLVRMVIIETKSR